MYWALTQCVNHKQKSQLLRWTGKVVVNNSWPSWCTVGKCGLPKNGSVRGSTTKHTSKAASIAVSCLWGKLNGLGTDTAREKNAPRIWNVFLSHCVSAQDVEWGSLKKWNYLTLGTICFSNQFCRWVTAPCYKSELFCTTSVWGDCPIIRFGWYDSPADEWVGLVDEQIVIACVCVLDDVWEGKGVRGACPLRVYVILFYLFIYL